MFDSVHGWLPNQWLELGLRGKWREVVVDLNRANSINCFHSSLSASQRSGKDCLRDWLPLSRITSYYRCCSGRLWRQQPEVWIPSWKSMLQWLTLWQRQTHTKACAASFQQEKLGFNCCPKQYLLCYDPVCGGFYLRLFNSQWHGFYGFPAAGIIVRKKICNNENKARLPKGIISVKYI